jgi:hypothetical protein
MSGQIGDARIMAGLALAAAVGLAPWTFINT